MFNLFPGQGLGYAASKQLAFGLGYALLDVTTPVILRDIKGGWVNPMEAIEDDHRLLVIKDDEEVIGIITTIMTSGIL